MKKIIAVGVKTTRIMSKFSMPWLELNFNFRGLTCPVYFLDTLCPFNSLQGTIASGDTGKSNTVVPDFNILCTAVDVNLSCTASFSFLCFLFLVVCIPKAG